MFRQALVLVAAAVVAAPARADTPDPLRFLPPTAQFAVKVENPRQLTEAVVGLYALNGADQFAPVRTLLDSTPARTTRPDYPELES